MKQKNILSWIRPEICALNAYHVPPAEGVTKLDAMENPYGWPQALKQQWLDLLREVPLNRYPDPAAQGLKNRIREAMKVPDEMNLVLGNGSDELIQMICMAVAGPGRKVMSLEPGFVMYRIIATVLGLEYVPVALNTDFSLDLSRFVSAIETHDPAVVFIAYPNNPTGNLFDEADIIRVLQAANGLVVIDEAYFAFCGRSFLDKMSAYDNVLVMGTVSKLGLAGLRLGFLAGPAVCLDQLEKIRLPYNINVLTQASAEFALDHKHILDEQTEKIVADREQLYGKMQQLESITCFPSAANFILFRVDSCDAGDVFDSLLQQKVLIKNLANSGGLLKQCLRVTVGTPEENARFISALQASF